MKSTVLRVLKVHGKLTVSLDKVQNCYHKKPLNSPVQLLTLTKPVILWRGKKKKKVSIVIVKP